MISQPKAVLKRDPFYVDPPPKAHYHPTEKKNLTEDQKKTAISPVRSATRKENEPERLSYNDELFLKGGNTFTSKANHDKDDSGSSKFDESWPSTDRPLSVMDEDHPLNDIIFQRKGDRFADLKKTLDFPEKDYSADHRKSYLLSQNGKMRQETSSTLQKYIERFRTGQPMSREDRQKATSSSQKDFWWLSDRSFTDSSTPKDDSPGAKRTRRFTPHSPISPYKTLAEKKTSQNLSPHTLDDTTKLLQEKADRLLDSASSVASSDPIVSTDGLGSSQSFSTTISSVEEQAYRPTFARKWESKDKPSYQIPKLHVQRSQPAKPEDDVLYQWRLKRRMEQARDNAAKSPAVKFGFKEKSQGQKDVNLKIEEFKQKLAGKNIPQDVSTEYGINPENRNFTDIPVSHGSVQFTPAPKLSHDMPCNLEKQFPVASPMLHHTTGANKLEPHFHLTCDILPHTYQSHKAGQESQHKHKDFEVENIKGDKSKLIKRNTKEPDDISTVEDVQSDRYRFLQAERPDVEKKENIESESTLSDHDEKYKNSKLMDDKRDNSEMRFIKSEQKKEQENVLKKDVIDNDNENDKIRTQISTRRGQLTNENKDKYLDSKVKNQETLTDKIPVLKPSEKPTIAKPAVECAIGQVIKDRLFDISTSTVMSSIDSEASSPQRQPKFTEKQNRISADNNLDDNYESDGEYPDDQLLYMLRQQRAQYEEQLRHIDEMLARVDPEDR